MPDDQKNDKEERPTTATRTPPKKAIRPPVDKR